MNPTITLHQAKQITGGRTPHVPIQYEEALKSLQACIDLDDAKIWSDKADALAAWAKIYRNDDAGRKAAALKLHAYRKMGQLAAELRPRKSLGRGLGTTPGAMSLLREKGLTQSQALCARAAASLPQKRFDDLAERERPPAITAMRLEVAPGSSAYLALIGRGANGVAPFASFCRTHPAAAMARALSKDEARKIKEYIPEICEWLDVLDANLKTK